MSILTFMWIVIHPWFWVAGAALLASTVLYTHNHRKLAYLAIAASIFPFWQSMQNGIEYVLLQITNLLPGAITLLKTLPYVWATMVLIGFLFWIVWQSKVAVKQEKRQEEDRNED